MDDGEEEKEDFSGVSLERFGLLELEDTPPKPKANAKKSASPRPVVVPSGRAVAPETVTAPAVLSVLPAPAPASPLAANPPAIRNTADRFAERVSSGTLSRSAGSGLGLATRQVSETQSGFRIPANEAEQRRVFFAMTGRTPEEWVQLFESGQIRVHPDELSRQIFEQAYALRTRYY